jgi:hypothetical protein
MDFAPQVWAKCDPELRRALGEFAQASAEELPVLVVLAPSSEPPAAAPGVDPEARRRWARERERLFELRTRELVAALAAAGGLELRPFWVAGVISGLLPPSAIDVAGGRDDVARLELIVRRQVAL